MWRTWPTSSSNPSSLRSPSDTLALTGPNIDGRDFANAAMDLRTPMLFLALVLPRGLRSPPELETVNSTLPFKFFADGDPPPANGVRWCECASRNRRACAERGLTESGGVDVARRARCGVPGSSPAQSVVAVVAVVAGEGGRGAVCAANLTFCGASSRSARNSSEGTGGYWGSDDSLICATRD